jgi:hypothetical protein
VPVARSRIGASGSAIQAVRAASLRNLAQSIGAIPIVVIMLADNATGVQDDLTFA